MTSAGRAQAKRSHRERNNERDERSSNRNHTERNNERDERSREEPGPRAPEGRLRLLAGPLGVASRRDLGRIGQASNL